MSRGTLCILLLLLSIFVHTNALVTRFHFSGILTCDLSPNAPFVQSMSTWESDWKKDDHLQGYTDLFQNEKPYKYEMVVADDDDGMFDNWYEIYFKIEHNCTADRMTKESRIDVGEFRVEHGDVYYNFDVDATKLK